MRRAVPFLVGALSCGGAKAVSSEPLVTTRLELTLDDGTTPPPAEGRAFAVVETRPPSAGQLNIFVFDAKVPQPTCTDVNVGGWMDDLGGGSASVVYVASFSGRPGKYSVASVAHVRGAGAKGKVDLRSASARGTSIEITRYDELFEATLVPGTAKSNAAGKIGGIVCAPSAR